MHNYCNSGSHGAPYLIFLSILLMVSRPLSIYAQGVEVAISEDKSIRYFVEVPDTLLSIRLSVNNEFESFRQNGDDFLYDIRPNISVSTKFSFSYRYVSFAFGITPKFIPGNNDNDKKGSTNAFLLGFSFNKRHLIQELKGVRVKGFYLHNTGDFIQDWNKDEDPYLQLPELKVIALRGTTSYKFNPNFSVNAISTQTEIQLRSCGSFIPSLSYDYYIVDNKAPDAETSQRSNNFEAAISLGYYYTFVINKRFYASLGITPGYGFSHTNLTTRTPQGNVNSAYTDPLFRAQEGIGLGYNTKRLFTGVQLSMVQTIKNENRTSVQLEAKRVYFQVFAGYHFIAPRVIRREADIVKEKAPKKVRKYID